MAQSAVAKSRILKAIIYLHWAAPMGYIIGLAAFYNLPWPTAVEILFDFYYIGRSAFSVWVGCVLYQSKPWAWHVYLINAMIMAAEQFYFGLVLADTHLVYPSIFVALSVIATGVFLVKIEFRVPYFSPQIPWWESDPRYKISVPVQLTSKERFFTGEIMDIGATGCFVKTKADFTVDDSISLRFSLFEKEFICKGKVMWNTESALTHPKGVGVRFFDMPKDDFASFKNTVKKLRGVSKKLRQDRREEKVSSFEKKLRASIDDKS